MARTCTYLRAFFLAYAVCFAVQAMGGYFTAQAVGEWYRTLHRSPLNPPGYVFGVMWTLLYFLMAVAAARLVGVQGRAARRPLRWWSIQLLLGLLWTMVFFGQHNIGFGMALLATGWGAVLVSVRLFWRADRLAGALMLPLLAWVSFACYLNFFIWQHN
jgi:benzodiazapine receptor